MSKLPPNKHIPQKLELNDQVLIEAAQKFDTPLYVYDANLMLRKWDILQSLLPDKVSVFYSVKANPNIFVIDIFRELGAAC